MTQIGKDVVLIRRVVRDWKHDVGRSSEAELREDELSLRDLIDELKRGLGVVQREITTRRRKAS